MSLYAMAKDVETLLHAKKFPVRVHYGPERMHREGFPENVIVIERDHEASDTIGPPRGAQRNPRKLRTRGLASVAHVYARSSRAGARVQDHQELCEKFNDALFAAMANWAAGNQAIELAITESRYLSAQERLTAAQQHVTAKEALKVETWPGVVYRIKFSLPRALFDVDYSGDGSPEGTLAAPGIRSRTEAEGPGYEDPATGCDSTEP